MICIVNQHSGFKKENILVFLFVPFKSNLLMLVLEYILLKQYVLLFVVFVNSIEIFILCSCRV